MKRIGIALLLLFALGLSLGCNMAKDEVRPDGTKIFGKRTLKDGTQTEERVEYTSGEKDFNQTLRPDGSSVVERIEATDGSKWFIVNRNRDGSLRASRVEYPGGEKHFVQSWLKDGTATAERVEMPGGEKRFNQSWLKDDTATAERAELPDGTKQFNLSWPMDGSERAGRVELPNGQKQINVIVSPATRVFLIENDPGWSAASSREPSEAAAYLRAHKDDYRIIAGFVNDHPLALDEFPHPLMEIREDAVGDSVLFYKGERDNSIYVKTFIRLSVREMDATLAKFRSLKQQETGQIAASRAPYSAMIANALGSDAAEQAGYRRKTPEQIQATYASLKADDQDAAEKEVWSKDVVLAAQVKGGEYYYVHVIRPDTRFFLVNKESGAILVEVPRSAICYTVKTVMEDQMLHDCTLTPREQ